MCHSVAFECVNDAKKNDWNIYMYFHMEPDENRTEVRKHLDLRHGFRFSPGSMCLPRPKTHKKCMHMFTCLVLFKLSVKNIQISKENYSGNADQHSFKSRQNLKI